MKQKSKKENKKLNHLLRAVFITSGTIFLSLGIIGIFIPILPTTPFLLLAASCYARSSQKFYNWLMKNRLLGNYIKNYLEGRGIPLKFKILTIFLLWITILASIYLVIIIYWVEMILIIIAAGVTIHIITIKTYRQ